jgi:hypothetical protein
MCAICEGRLTAEEALDRTTELIARQGWTVQPVMAGPHNLSWAYTIGLTARGHPELVVVDTPEELAIPVLHLLAEHARDGEALQADHAIEVAGLEFRLAGVHPAHAGEGTNLFTVWHEVYGWLPEPPQLRVLEVIPPDEVLCTHHRGPRPYLAGPTHRLWSPVLPRATRRAHRHHRGRR